MDTVIKSLKYTKAAQMFCWIVLKGDGESQYKIIRQKEAGNVAK
jgi:hypothetical protein